MQATLFFPRIPHSESLHFPAEGAAPGIGFHVLCHGSLLGIPLACGFFCFSQRRDIGGAFSVVFAVVSLHDAFCPQGDELFRPPEQFVSLLGGEGNGFPSIEPAFSEPVVIAFGYGF